jgi:hypothetical protein
MRGARLPRGPARRGRASVPAGLGPAAVVWDNGDAPRLPDEAADAGKIDATAAALLSAKITAPRQYVGRTLGDERHDRAAALDRVAAELARVSVLLAAATEGLDDDEDDDDEPYCVTCGRWMGMFHGLEDWRHFRGEGTAASPVELYDPGHEAAVAWTIPAGRSLCPADIALIGQALADAAAWRSWRAEGAHCEGCQRLDPGRCAGHAADQVAELERLAGR